MADVARAAGVSPTTVSFVINGGATQHSIPESTQKRVRVAVQDLGYRPNQVARGLRTRSSQTIGFITDEAAAGAFGGAAIRGAAAVAWQREHLLTILHTGSDPELEAASVELAWSRQFEGVVLSASHTRQVEVPPNLGTLPAVLLDCFAPGSGLTSVRPAEFDGGVAATRMLLDAGHRRIGFVNGIRTSFAGRERLRGYRAALQDAGLSYDAGLVRYGTYEADSGHRHAHDLLTRTPAPTALFCANDRMAVGAYLAILQRGLTIPGDVSVVGYDNQANLAEFLTPALTTVEVPHHAMGVKAVELLLDRETRQSGEGVVHEIPCRPIVRASVVPPRPA